MGVVPAARPRADTSRPSTHCGEAGIIGLKTTFLLGGNPNPEEWDEETKELADMCFDAAEKHDYVFHFHTSAGGNSDINNFIPMVEAYGKRCKIHLVHFGGGVSGHIKLVPKFLQWVKDGYKVYTDTSWAIGFGARWLLVEIEKQGIGGDRVIFGSDEPWSDFMSEYWKIEGAPVSEELKRMVLVDNFAQAPREALVSTAPGPRPARPWPSSSSRSACGPRTADEGPGATRAGGAGPSDAGFIWLDGAPLTVPVHGDYVASSPYELVMNGSGRAGTLLRDGVEVGPGAAAPAAQDLRPRDGRRGPLLEDRPDAPRQPRVDGLPALRLLGHRTSSATSARSAPASQNGRTVPVKTPALLAEVAEAAARLDGAKDVTLTTGTPNRDDRGAPYMARCAEAIRDASGLPVQVQIEPPADFSWFGALKDERRRGARAAPGGLGRGGARARRPGQARPGPRPLPRRLGGGRRRVRPRARSPPTSSSGSARARSR